MADEDESSARAAYIDSHAHVFSRLSSEFPRRTSDLFPAEREEPVEKLLGEMESNGVSQAVLVQIGGSSLEHHAYLRHCLKEYPGRLCGIGCVPTDSDSIPAHMDRLADYGIIGFRLSSMGGPVDPLEPVDVRDCITYPIWKRAAEKDYVLYLYPRAIDSHVVPFLLDAFPQVRVVFNHLMVCPGEGRLSIDDKGRPHVDVAMPPMTRYSTMGLKVGRVQENTRGLHQYENVCVQISGQYAFSREAWPYRDLADWHACLKFVFGSSRLMWATDFPWIVEDPGYGRLVSILEELLPDLSDAERADVMGGTASAFLQFPGRGNPYI